MPVDGLENFLAAHAPLTERGRFAEGTCFGEWRTTAYIGCGSCGEVYCAVHAMTGVPAALKVLVRSEPRARARFEREARLLALNTHRSLSRFLGAGEAGGYAYLVVELLEPCELPCGDAGVASYIQGVCGGLAELHRRGFVHRDLKPAHVMRRANGDYVLIDLGLACEADADIVQDADSPSVVEGRMLGVGTPGYSAPEQFEGSSVSYAADIHALGRMVDACFGGKPPRCWREIVRRATSSLPDYRYPDVAAFLRAVHARHRTRTVLAAAALVAVLVLAWSCSHLLRIPSAEPGGLAKFPGEHVMTNVVTRVDLPDAVVTSRSTNVRAELACAQPQYLRLGRTRLIEGQREVVVLHLHGRTNRLERATALTVGKEYRVIGPGRLVAELVCPGATKKIGATMRLVGCELDNMTNQTLPSSGIHYVLEGASRLNFPALQDDQDRMEYVEFDGRLGAVNFGR